MSDYINMNQSFTPVATAIEAISKTHALPKLTGGSGRGWSRWKLLQRCPYAYYLRYIRQLVIEEESSALAVGSLFHAFAATYYHHMITQGKSVTVDAFKAALDDQNVSAEALYKSWYMFEAYRNHYCDDFIIPVAVEHQVEDLKTGNTCRYDLVAQIKKPPEGIKPGFAIVEHKSASRLDASTIDGWDLDGEILGEVVFWQRNRLDKVFGPLTVLIVNVVTKSKVTGFNRTYVHPLSARSAAHIRNLSYMTNLESRLKKANRWPQYFGSCIGRFGRCEYYDHCLSGGDAR